MNSTTSHQNINVINHDVTFYNTKDDITLSGTLSVPSSAQKSAVVILVAGMGPFDQDCNLMNGHKLFVSIANYFTQCGIAVLRYDKRGIGKSGGVFNTAFTFDFAQDVLAAVQFLKQRPDIDTQKIGLVGHSEGGLISFIVASKSPDVAFMISMAGGVITNIDDVVLQTGLQFKADGAPDEFIASDKIIRTKMLETVTTLPADDAEKKLRVMIKAYIDGMTNEQKAYAKTLFAFALTEQNYEQRITIANTSWRVYLLSDPLQYISKVTVPVLAINGALDFMLPAKLALPIIKHGLEIAGNHDVTLIAIPNQNHCFQQCQTGALSEYITIKETIHESTLKLMTDWIVSKV